MQQGRYAASKVRVAVSLKMVVGDSMKCNIASMRKRLKTVN